MRDPEAAPLLRPLPEEEWFATWHLVLRDRRLVGYGVGLVELLRCMWLTRPLARGLGLIGDRELDRLYAVVAGNRSRLGRLVPDRPGPHRYP